MISLQVNRDYVVECFFHKYPVLKDLVEYCFEPHDKDTISVISKDHGAEIFLEKDARKVAMKLVKQQASIATTMKQIKGLKSVTSAYTKVSYRECLHVWIYCTIGNCILKMMVVVCCAGFRTRSLEPVKHSRRPS